MCLVYMFLAINYNNMGVWIRWTGMVEWNGMECGKLRSIKAHIIMWHHLSSYEKFLVCGAVSLG